MEVTVCILTTLFFAGLEIRDMKIRANKKKHAEIQENEFVVLPHHKPRA